MSEKITLSTIKAFIKKTNAANNLYVKVNSDFDGMTDCVQAVNGKFKKAEKSDHCESNTLGIKGVWCVLRSNDYFSKFDEDGFEGYEIYNSCGSSSIAKRKN